jgi:hypothetical protein
MSHVPFDSLPDTARVWCFAAEPEPGPRETARLLDDMQAFVETWTAHRADLVAAVDWWHQRFLLVGLDESHTGASGCSIDALMARLASLEEELGIRLTDSARVWYRDTQGRIRSVAREEFRRMSSDGTVGPDTRVFDLTVTEAGSARENRLERRTAESWHARLL